MSNYNTITEVSANVVSIETGEFTRTYKKTDLKCSITDRLVFVYYYTDSSNTPVASWTLEQAIAYGYSTLAELKAYIDSALSIIINSLVFIEVPPVAADTTGVKGQAALDEDYLYICADTNLWKRIPLTW